MDKVDICEVNIEGMKDPEGLIASMSMFISSSDPMKHDVSYCYDCRNICFFHQLGIYLATVNSDEMLIERNNKFMSYLEDYMTSHLVVTKFLLGSWLIDNLESDYPLSPIGVIIISSDFYLTTYHYIEDMLLIVTSNLKRMIYEDHHLIYKHDMIAQSSGKITFFLNDRNVKTLHSLGNEDLNPITLSTMIKRKEILTHKKIKIMMKVISLRENHDVILLSD